MEEDKYRINRLVLGESFLSSYFLFCTLESISCKFHEYVGNPRPSVIRCSFLYNKRYSKGDFCEADFSNVVEEVM